MKKLFSLLLTVMLCSAVALAQRTVSGTVVSALDGDPVVGATVMPLPTGSGNGTATDIDGNFTLKVSDSCHELQFSFVGMATQIVRIPANGKMHVTLSDTENRLDEVMVVAYGTAKRSEYTGSASVVNADDLADALVTSVTSALQGKVSGVQTLSSNGQPGEAPTIRIRGIGSINASASPLYVVDGVPYDGDIANLATTDIESMTVLKDAASTALYGARGANGVVLITTKRGSTGDAKITFESRWGSNSRGVSNYNVLTSAEQYMETLYSGYYNYALSTPSIASNAQDAWLYANNQIAPTNGGGGVLGYQIYTVPTGERLFGTNGKINPNATLGYSDGTYYYTPDNWLDNTVTNGLRQEYNLGVSGGTDRVKYYLSGAYLGDEGIINNSDFSRFSTRATVDYQAKKWLKIGTNLSYTYTTTNYSEDSNLDYSSSSGNAFYLANRIAPIYPMFVRDADGNVMYNSTYNHPIYDYGDGSSTNYTRNFMSIANPIGSLLYDTSRTLHDVFDGKWYATLTPIEGLTITGNVGYYLSNLREHVLSNPFYGQSSESGGFAEQYFARTRSINYQALASYNRTFADLHNFDIMAGYETYNLEREYAYAYGYNLYDPTGWNVSNTIDQISGKGARDIQYTTRGILARAKYNYASKYFGHVSYRRDASSRFAPGHRWGNFWSVSGAWDIAKESFMEQFTNVDHLKFKASFGQNGNDNLGSDTYYYYAWADQYQITGADGVWSDATLYYKGNKDLTWETSNAFNTGFDFSFFQGKLSGSAEYFSRQTSDMLFNIPVAPSLGYTSYPANVGSMRNNGIEIELNANIINNKNIQWDVNANITTMGNKILSLPDYLEGEWIDGSRIYREGDSMYSLYLVKYAGVDSNTGEALYWGRYADGTVIDGVDVSGQEVKTTNWNACYSGDSDSNLVANRESTGSLLPKAYGGFGTTLRAYGFDFSLSFAYQFGGKIFDSSYQSLMHAVNSSYNGQNWHSDILNAWTPTNTETDVPRVQYGDKYTASTSTRFLVSSNFLSLNNITLGYTLPSKFTRRFGISSLRFYGAAENVALWAKRKGLDPRQGYASSNNSTYSPIRTISGGLRVEF